MLDVLRYARGASRVEVELDGYLNYHFITSSPDTRDARLMLERGINPAAPVSAPDGVRRPVIAIRSSPWTAGPVSNPSHDEFDLDHGHVRYYGDHKPDTAGLPGATAGNRALLEAWRHHAGTSERERAAAPPLLLFRSITVNQGGRRVVKGHVEFCGVAIIERLEHVIQRDPATGRSFPTWFWIWQSSTSQVTATPWTCAGSATGATPMSRWQAPRGTRPRAGGDGPPRDEPPSPACGDGSYRPG